MKICSFSTSGCGTTSPSGSGFLYDNSGSRYLDNGNNLEITARNKRGEDVYRLLAHLDDAAIARELDRLVSPFERRGVVTRVPWQPRDAEGRITYGQVEAFLDYGRRFRRASEWTSFTDLDEFVVPVRHPGMPDVLDELARRKVTYVRMPQQCFASRFDDNGQPVPRVLNIAKCSDWVEPELLRFNHYKFNRWELDWVATNLGHPLMLDCEDRGMERFAPAMAGLDL